MKHHPPSEQLWTFVRALTARGEQGVLSHLLRCPSCARLALSSLTDPTSPGAAGDPGDTVPGHHPLPEGEGWAIVAGEGHEHSAALLAELLAAPPRARRELLTSGRRRSIWAVADQAFREALSTLDLAPRRSAELVHIGLAVVARLDSAEIGRQLVADLEARGQVLRGELDRRRGRLEPARRSLAAAGRRLAGSLDPLEGALLEHARGLLNRDQGQATLARRYLENAESLYREVGDDPHAARVAHSAALLELRLGQPETALDLLAWAESLAGGEAPWLKACLAFHRGVALTECGRFAEARKELVWIRSLGASVPGLASERRLLWLEGWLHAGAGGLEAAAVILAQAQARPVRSAAERWLVALDESAVLLELEHRGELRRSAAKRLRSRALQQGAPAAVVEWFRLAAAEARPSRRVLEDALQEVRSHRLVALTLGEPL
jgi:hypothetical protein